MNMEASRTFIGSVVCLDLVGYSKWSVAQQSEIKGLFNQLLVQVLKRVPPEDRIILDTGDGAAISFLGDPEQSLAIGLELRDAMNKASARLGGADGGPVRIGINLGPLKLGVDMNGHPKIIGDGINVAETICGFANAGQVVVSRPFHDMVSRISNRHAQIFNYEGVRTDKNVREHEIYSVRPAVAEAPAATEKPRFHAAGGVNDESGVVRFLRDVKKVSIAAAVLVAIILSELVMLAYRFETASTPTIATPTAPQVAKAPVANPAPLPEKPAQALKPVEAKKAEPPKVEAPKKLEPPKVEAPKLEPPKQEPPKKLESPKKTEPAKSPITETKAPEKKPAEPPRTIPSPRTSPAQVAPTAVPSPSIAPTEPVPAIREEPKAPAAATQANPISRTPATFPLAAVNRGVFTGTVRARLKINAAGSVTDVVILSSDPPRIFDRAATSALESWRFNAGADNRTYDVELDFKR
jgi:TonB family protein